MEDFFNVPEGPEQLNLKRKTIDVKLIVGIVLVLVSIFMKAVSNVIDFGGIYSLKFDDGYFIGGMIGSVIVTVIIAAAILITSKSNRGRNLLIFSIIALLVSFNSVSTSITNAAAERQKQEAALDKVVSIVKDLVSQKEIVKEDISEEKYGKSAPIIQSIQDAYLELQELRKENDIIVGIMNEPSIFSKETLSDLNKIKEKRALLDKTTNDIEVLGNKLNDLIGRFKSSLENLDVSSIMKAGIEDGLQDSLIETTLTISNNLKHMNNVIKGMKNMIVFLEEKQGAYTFEGEQLAFYEDDDVDAYNKLFNEYSKAIDENNKNYESVQKNINEKIKEMEKLSE